MSGEKTPLVASNQIARKAYEGSDVEASRYSESLQSFKKKLGFCFLLFCQFSFFKFSFHFFVSPKTFHFKCIIHHSSLFQPL